MPRDLPAILFEPEGYAVNGPTVVGRQSAGHGFLRAAVQASHDGVLSVYTAQAQSAQSFAASVKALDPSVQPQWIPAHRLDGLARLGCLYLPDPGLGAQARLRLRAGPAAYSLCGITHTLSSHWAMDALKQLLSAPVMPWDALICTSQAAKAVVLRVMEEEHAYLRWRLGSQIAITMPQLPVIPLGVHASDFEFHAAQRADARARLGIDPDEVVLLYAGRLSHLSKAHPHAMYAAAEAAAQQTGLKLTLILCGRFGSEGAEHAFREGAKAFCPGVRTLFMDASDETMRPLAWAAGEVFISLSDNIQETFGLTPVEAMACGMPVLVTDWNGYKDTVREGLDGHRIPTWMAAPGAGESWAGFLEAGSLDAELYSALTAQAVAVDLSVLVDRLVGLLRSPERRRVMGRQARQRALDVFDWPRVFGRYQVLWDDLAKLRQSAASGAGVKDSSRASAAPRADAARLDPFRLFEGYGSRAIGAQSVLHWVEGIGTEQAVGILQSPLYAFAVPSAADAWARLVHAMEVLQRGDLTVEAWARTCHAPVPDMVLLACQLAKAGLLVSPTSAA